MDPLKLESSVSFEPVQDRRPRIEEPLPVKLVAVADVCLVSRDGLDQVLDEFYVGLWGFERDVTEVGLLYRADNHRLRFEIIGGEGPIARQTLRPLGIEIVSLAEAEQKLAETQREFIRQRGLTPGQETLLVQDPAGNWVEISEASAIG